MAARKPSERRHGRDQDTPELNLVPIMAIMVILIPMLIYMFNFSEIKIQRVTAPRRGTGAQKTKEEKKAKPLNLTIMIDPVKGFTLNWEPEHMGSRKPPVLGRIQSLDEYCPDENKPGTGAQGCSRLAGTGPCLCYDFPGLYKKLVELKVEYSKDPEKPERRVNLTAHDEVTWAVVSRTMDAANCRLKEDVYPDLKSYVAAVPKYVGWACIKKKPGGGETKQMFDKQPEEKDCKYGMVVHECEELFPKVVFAMTE